MFSLVKQQHFFNQFFLVLGYVEHLVNVMKICMRYSRVKKQAAAFESQLTCHNGVSTSWKKKSAIRIV